MNDKNAVTIARWAAVTCSLIAAAFLVSVGFDSSFPRAVFVAFGVHLFIGVQRLVWKHGAPL